MVAFLDLSKAYDRVWRDGLRHKLLTQFRAKGRLLRWLSNFLQNRRARVVLQGSASPYTSSSLWLPQCSPLSHVFFDCYVNDATSLPRPPSVEL